jgi:hypothetical protein
MRAHTCTWGRTHMVVDYFFAVRAKGQMESQDRPGHQEHPDDCQRINVAISYESAHVYLCLCVCVCVRAHYEANMTSHGGKLKNPVFLSQSDISRIGARICRVA